MAQADWHAHVANALACGDVLNKSASSRTRGVNVADSDNPDLTSMLMKQLAEPGRPHDWINQKTCAAQYNLLEERFDIKRPKRGEKIEAGESPMELIVKKLSQERIDELGIIEY